MPPSLSGTIIVVGASSGIGRALAMQLAHEARPVAIVARRAETLDEVAREINDKVGARRAFPFEHDVSDIESVDRLFTRIEAELGQVDELHYTAGIMPEVEIDEFPTDKDAAMQTTNAIGCMAWVNAAARRFLPRKQGHIVGVTSVAGDRGRLDRPGYNASKACQDTFLESIRNRLWRHGIKVTTARPGPVHTPMTEGLDVPMAISAESAAKSIVKARDRGRAIVYVPFKWRIIMFVIRSIPSFLFRRMSV
ncbi:MAG: SDR family NAD(P)-dependent oxidoreductase [Planctomycetes bacterium]|nr:SDR family NAD(P)-dependent oxidoreductase [Planctomycetota bacterium]